MGEKMQPKWVPTVIEGGKSERSSDNPAPKSDPVIAENPALVNKDVDLSPGSLSDLVKEMFLAQLGGGYDQGLLGTGNVDKSARQYVDIVRGYDLETLRNFRDHPDTKNKPAFLRAINDEIRRKLLAGDDTEE